MGSSGIIVWLTTSVRVMGVRRFSLGAQHDVKNVLHNSVVRLFALREGVRDVF